MTPERSRRIAMAGAAGVALGGVALLWFYDPAAPGPKLFPPCPFLAITGCYCPGCGTLRATHQLLHGHFGPAFRLNPLMVLSLPLLALMLLRIDPVHRLSRHPRAPWLCGATLLLYGVLRNLPGFTFLGPSM